MGLTDGLQCSSSYLSSNLYQLMWPHTDTHSGSSLPSAREGCKASDFFGLLARRKMSSSHVSCKPWKISLRRYQDSGEEEEEEEEGWSGTFGAGNLSFPGGRER